MALLFLYGCFYDLARKLLSLRLATQRSSFESLGQELCFDSGAEVTANQRTYNGVKRPPKKVRAALLQSYFSCSYPNLVCYGLSQSILSRHQDNNKDFVCFQKCYLHSNKRYAKVGLQFHQKQIWIASKLWSKISTRISLQIILDTNIAIVVLCKDDKKVGNFSHFAKSLKVLSLNVLRHASNFYSSLKLL